MQHRTLYDVLFYWAAVLGLAAATWFVLFFLMNAFVLIFSITENSWWSDWLTEYIAHSKGFSRILVQILSIAVVYHVGHFMWQKARRS